MARFTRFLVTALPTRRLTVIPSRTPPCAGSLALATMSTKSVEE
jgi:hypothetical protein